MIIAGGTYGERCMYPKWDHIYGSGLRAAVAVSQVSPKTILHSYVPPEWRADVEATLSGMGIAGALASAEGPLTFSYLHALEKLELPEIPKKRRPTLEVAGDVVLRFGMLEGDARVHGDRVVYDPQSSGVLFQENGSRSEMLAVIMAGSELGLSAEDEKRQADDVDRYLPPLSSMMSAVVDWRDQGSAPHVIVIKDGLGGLVVFQGDEPTVVPTYAAESFFRIGSGDVIAAAFAHAWGELRLDAVEAADYAARCAAYFVEGPRLPLPSPRELANRQPAQNRKNLRILGIGDFPLHSLVVETRKWIEYLGGAVRHVTFDPSDRSNLDGTVDLVLVGNNGLRPQFEMVASVAIKPAVMFWPGDDIEMARYVFPGTVITQDYATALYHAMRGAKA